MAEDIVILLSSDDSDNSDAFVTPHPRTASVVDDRSPGLARLPETSRLLDLQLPTASPARTQRHVDVIEIDETPEPPVRDSGLVSRSNNPPPAVRCGFLGFSSDELFSSPFPGTAPTQLQRAQNRPLPTTHRSPLQDTIQEKAANAATQRHRTSRVVDDNGNDDYDSISQDRPAKRLRLFPGVEASSMAPRAKSPTIGMSNRLPRQSHQVLPSQSAQLLSCFMVDFGDDMDDLPPMRPTKTQQTATQQISIPKADTECIDLLSSSDSEANRTGSTAGAPVADSDFVDIDDLLVHPSPRPRKQQKTHHQTEDAGGSAPGHKRQHSAEIMLLSSSPVTSTTTRLTSRPIAFGPAPTQTQRRHRPMQRSHSEGHALAFFDEDDEDDVQFTEELLAEWRKHCQAAAPAAAATRRRSSFDGTAAARQKKPSNPATALTEAEREARQKERDKTRQEKEKIREEKRREKEAEKERRLKEKEVDKERRRIASDIAKEKKAKERAEAAAFNDANKSRVDKAVAAPEMIVRLPRTLPQATKEVAETMLGEAKASHEAWTSSPVDNVVTWRRKVSNEYKPDFGHWMPVPTRIEDEKQALVVLRGEDFVQLILASHGDPDARRAAGDHDLDSHVDAMKSAFAGHTIIYLIEGLNAWKSKNRTIRNRQFVAAVRNGGGDGSTVGGARSGSGGNIPATAAAALARSEQSSQQQLPLTTQQLTRPSQRLGRRGQKQAPQHLDEALVDDALLELQIEHSGDSLLIHETASSLDTARWIKIFTEQIAISRYRQQREELYAAAASFCMDSGQIATGDDAADMYALMLQQVGRVTEPVALGVASRFDSVPKLLHGFAEEGPLALEACLKSRNRNGALSDRTIGQALSRRLYKVFMGKDEESTDV